MKNLIGLILSIALITVSCAAPPEVVQGTVVLCDESAKIVSIQDSAKPVGALEFHFEGAEVGASPQPGDTIRIAYREENGTLKATRIMNISRQTDLKSGK